MADGVNFPVWLYRPPYGGPAMFYWAGESDLGREWWRLMRGNQQRRP